RSRVRAAFRREGLEWHSASRTWAAAAESTGRGRPTGAIKGGLPGLALIALGSRGAHDLRVVRLLLAQERRELGGREAAQQRALLLELAADLGRGERVVQLAVEPLDDRRRCLRRREQPGPRHHVEALELRRLRERGNL